MIVIIQFNIYNNNINSANKFCFANFKESNKNNPFLSLDNIWHPYLEGNIIKNNIVLGKYLDYDYNNIIITGANASGKSTFIKTVVISILLSQTLTISCATNAILTPFSVINTYLNIPDCKGKESLFEAEMNRSKKYIEKLINIQKNEFAFVVMDEIFSSTNPEEGAMEHILLLNI